MKADFTRKTFHPSKQFTRVLMQQGRVQLDADWNEQSAILTHYLRALAADIIGPAAGPAANLGFQISAFDAALGVKNDFLIGVGRYYVDGLLCEISPDHTGYTLVAGAKNKIQVGAWSLDGLSFDKLQYIELDGTSAPSPVFTQITDIEQSSSTLTVAADLSALTITPGTTLRRAVTFLTQPGLSAGNVIAPGRYIVYLDVWERAITYVQDDAIREVALGGPDTAARSKVVWQVRLFPRARADNPDVVAILSSVNRGAIKAIAKQSAASTDPCTISPDAKYRGAQNQLYRVEIHTDGTAAGGATFKWSRENGSVVFPILRSAGSSAVVLEDLGRDDRFGVEEGDWVEAEDDSTSLLGTAAPLLQIQSIDRTTNTVTLSGPVGIKLTSGNPLHPLLRRWDQTGDQSTIAIVEDSATWLSLESGIQVQFQKPFTGAVEYRTGDYWLIPARTATGDIEWPQETDTDAQGNTITVPLAEPPDGVRHHYAMLASVTVGADGQVGTVTDARSSFKPLG